jgi:hypothetical protein
MLSALEKTENSDEIILERLWGNQVAQLTPEVKEIIVSALRKARERMGRKSSSGSQA